jgi:hypothetical protein
MFLTSKGDVVVILKEIDGGWTLVKNPSGAEGYIPTSYLGALEDSKPAEPSPVQIDRISCSMA